jgi:hypothetical protein
MGGSPALPFKVECAREAPYRMLPDRGEGREDSRMG